MATKYIYTGKPCDIIQKDGSRITLDDNTSQKVLKKLFGMDKLPIEKVEEPKKTEEAD